MWLGFLDGEGAAWFGAEKKVAWTAGGSRVLFGHGVAMGERRVATGAATATCGWGRRPVVVAACRLGAERSEGIGNLEKSTSIDVIVEGSGGVSDEGDHDTSIDVGVEGSGGVCNTEHSTDGGVDRSGAVCYEGDHIDGCVEGSGGRCDEGNSTDVAVGASGEGANEHCSTDVGYAGSVGFDCRHGTLRKRRDGVVVERQVNRSLDAGHQMFIVICVRANIGYVRSYKLFKEIVGEYSNVGATGVDFKNFKRDFMAYILNGDAQLFIDTLFKRRELCEAFEFEYDVDDVDQLTRVFWADAVSRKSFSLFGDVVLFDATYRSNRYNLVFVPFTGIDNHKRSITFGAGLLTREDVDSYVWLLERFKTTMRHEPICVVTDKDPAIKIAVARVFGTSKHRFCMWHIMCKVGEKVGPVLAEDEVFRRKLNGIVWNKSIDSKAFEDSWSRIIEEYGLVYNGWFRYLFESRTFSASPYFHDEFMSGFVRTTSRSESRNSFFGSFSNGHSSLVEFLVHFDSVISAQRHVQAKLTADSKSCFPVLKTPLALEKHAMDVYTISVFYDVQVEICEGCFSCRVVSLCECDRKVCYGIKDGDNKAWCVEFLLADSTATCSCKMFERMGLVCRHIFFVFKDRGLERIPSMYSVSRWTKGACLKPIFDIDDTVVDQSAKVDNVRVLANLMCSASFTLM
ncbi:PREDICTED: protein FAR1-RELATED SEQUENCE 5-like [Ipomoea nil]|uniref:protein FAR1-RELATED SEQUENCE 5-like n=1 Tax=Ipomoea nil TaxID=35883 RepID=UPI000900F9CD|nr:PREDICTED: protein FAR1-RELATED SEQUENCE 5-like [Ipomoea nil]